eukprot:gene61915-biopygen33065
MLFQEINKYGQTICTGLDYSKFAADGSDISRTAFLAYDAVIAMAIALDQVLYKQNNVNFTGDDLRLAIRTKVNFLGASGQVNFQNGRPVSEGYGLGDRLSGLVSDITCSNPVYHTRDGKVVVDAATVVEVQMPSEIRTVLSVAAAIALAVVCWFTFIVVLYMDDRIIKSAQPNMLLMMLFGGFLGSVRIILATLDL